MRKPQELTHILAQIENEMVEYLRRACRGRVTIPRYLGDYLTQTGLVQEIIPLGSSHRLQLLDPERAYTATTTGRRVYAAYEKQRHEKTSS